MTKKCKCFNCEKVRDCEMVDLSKITSKYKIKYYCINCIFDLGFY